MKMIKSLILVMALIVPNIAVAVVKQSGKVIGFVPYSVDEKEVLIFKLENNITTTCNTTGRFAIDSTSPRYKGTFSTVLAAYYAKTPIIVYYFPTCNSWRNSADVDFICVGSVNC